MPALEDLKRWIQGSFAGDARRRKVKRHSTIDPWAPFHRLRIHRDPRTHLQRMRIPDDRAVAIPLRTKEDGPTPKSRRLRIRNDTKTNLRHCMWAVVVVLVLLYAVIYFLY